MFDNMSEALNQQISEGQIDTPRKNHLKQGNHHPHLEITVSIPPKTETVTNAPSLIGNQSVYAGQSVSLLPLDSARVVTLGEKRKRVSRQDKFYNKGSYKDLTSALSVTRIGKIKNVVYRNQIEGRASEEKPRMNLEETLMFQRSRRLHKLEAAKKYQRAGSPPHNEERGNKKFKRTEEKRLAEEKKFRRHREKVEEPENNERMLHAKLLKKIREDPNMRLIDLIPEQSCEYGESVMEESSMQVFPSKGGSSNIVIQDGSNQILLPCEYSKQPQQST